MASHMRLFFPRAIHFVAALFGVGLQIILFTEAQRGENVFLNDFNRTLAEKYTREISSLDRSELLYYISILGQLAFYSRIYRNWIEQPSTSHSNYTYTFPQITFSKDIYKACIQGFTQCTDTIWNDTKVRNAFLFSSDIYNEFIIRKSEVRRLVHNEMFDFDFSAIYVMCWMTMNRISILEALPFCDIQPMSAFTEEDEGNEVAEQHHRNNQIWPAGTLATNLTLNGIPHITLGYFDTEPFRCAESSFCVNGCNPTPCPENDSCILKSDYNEDLAGMFKNLWNVSCSCFDAGYVYRFDVNKCVDINECLYVNCGEKFGENWECANLEGSYSCVCKLGFIPMNNTCLPIQLLSKTFWHGPAVARGAKFNPQVIVLLFCLLVT